tara:strand:- start:632 stop:1141 length:510 start_codon:yes stop_codon:yes gene_type:complete
MSAQYLNATTPNLSQKIRVYSAVVKENLDVEGEATVTSKMSVGSSFAAASLRLSGSGKITLPALVNYTQLTSETTPVTITGAEEQFQISTAVGSTFNPATTRLFNVNHTGVFDTTMVLVSRAGSVGTNQQLLTWCAYTATGLIRIALHNLSTIAASGQETIIIKLIQNV